MMRCDNGVQRGTDHINSTVMVDCRTADQARSVDEWGRYKSRFVLHWQAPLLPDNLTNTAPLCRLLQAVRLAVVSVHLYWRMILNPFEFALMNNPIRAAIQRHFEARRFIKMGGALLGGNALEIGCGRGIGVEIILDRFGATKVDAFDLDPRMVAMARTRLKTRGPAVRLWQGDAAAIAAPASTYDAVFDFGIIHHVPNWRQVLAEIRRVLRPGGLLYAEEPLGHVLNHPVLHRFCAHPVEDRFEAEEFREALHRARLVPLQERRLWGAIFWFVAAKPAGVPAQEMNRNIKP